MLEPESNNAIRDRMKRYVFQLQPQRFFVQHAVVALELSPPLDLRSPRHDCYRDDT